MVNSQSNRRGLHGIGGNQNAQTARADRDFSFREKFAQFFHGTAHAFLRGIVADAEGLRDFCADLLSK